MSDYCTNCIHLSKQSVANKTEWKCSRNVQWTSIPYVLQSLCGNPTKLAKCKEDNWFKHKEKQMTTQEKITVMQAHVNGKQIQYRQARSDKWLDTLAQSWSWDMNDYRIKPEPKYRPYNAEEMKALVGKQIKYQGYVMMITSYNEERNTIHCNPCGWYDAQYLLNHAKMVDGSPCGVEE